MWTSFLLEARTLTGIQQIRSRRWAGNIFNTLRANGRFLDETPDAIITRIDGENESVLCAIEFCSALQAGNQAWQRSGRAFSIGRTGCPYLYVVDFVKYELDSSTRERKALRFPNPAVPYSYINFSQETGKFVAQVYVRSEEFDKAQDPSLAAFDENNFADAELSAYIVKRMCGFNTRYEEESILRKNLEVVAFLAMASRSSSSFSPCEWKEIYSSRGNIVDYSIRNAHFGFHKKISEKGRHGKSAEMLDLIDRYSVGLASRELPFGIIPAKARLAFARGLECIYPSFNADIINQIALDHQNLVICLIKGFKPHGDDNRPDRGVLPFAVMLSNTNVEILTYIYGPVLERNFKQLVSSPERLAGSNGFWKSILALSNFVALDVPILSSTNYEEELLLNTDALKASYTSFQHNSGNLTQLAFQSTPLEYHEDDVDTGIHFLFARLMKGVCFEGMCNPPGGDWSGLSIIYRDHEVRWLSLPRENKDKRPDHVLEIYTGGRKPVLLVVESKERSRDLERNVGNGLINYIAHLMNYPPSVERRVGTGGGWCRSKKKVCFEDFEVISAAAYLQTKSQEPSVVFEKSRCDMLFELAPTDRGWDICIVPNTHSARALKSFIIRKVAESGTGDIRLC